MTEQNKFPESGFDPGHTPEAVTARTGDHYEHTDVRSRPLIVFMLSVLIALGLITVGIGGFGVLLFMRHSKVVRPRSELTTRTQPFPEPRLQSSPKYDMAQMLAEEQALQTNYGWVDRKAGLVRIPIDRAMDLVAQHGLPPKRTDIPTTAGAEAAARAAAALPAATAANIRAAAGATTSTMPATSTPDHATTTTRKTGP